MGVSASHRVNLIGQNFPKTIAHTLKGVWSRGFGGYNWLWLFDENWEI